MTEEEVKGDYEKIQVPLLLNVLRIKSCSHSGCVSKPWPFSWGKDADDAVHNAVVLEQWLKWHL